MDTEKPAFPRWIKPENGCIQLYCNFLNASWTLVDVSIGIGKIIPKFNVIDPGQPIEVEEQAAVTMSWASAKNLRDMLVNLVAAYEKTNGEIKPLNLVNLTPTPTGGGQYRN